MTSHTVTLHTDAIRLDQLLKLAGLVTTGGEAKHRIQAGEVQVDGSVETRRGHRVVPGTIVRLGDEAIHVRRAP